MYAIHQNILPSSVITHSLFLPNFTPSTIYPLPQPHDVHDTAQVKVVGNLIVAGGQDLRVFEIREETAPVVAAHDISDGLSGGRGDGSGGGVPLATDEEGEIGEDIGDSFFDNGPLERAPLKFETTRRLFLVTKHELHGIVTGLASLRTIESSVDGLDRLLVSFKDAKIAMLEWSRGDIATVSLHTYERCSQMVTGDLKGYIPLLRTDPLSRLAVLSLPEDALAILPVLQEQSELDPAYESFPRDVPYSPSFVLSLSDISPSIKNLLDMVFLPGFHSPTLAILFSPIQSWAGRYHSTRDTVCLEIRTFDPSSGGSYPLLTSVNGLPSDSLYIVAAPAELGGVVVVTETGIVHVDQSGRVVGAGVNAWWGLTTGIRGDKSNEARKLSLEQSRGVFVSDRDMILVLANGNVHQVRFEMDGRAVGTIKVDESTSTVPAPSSVVVAGDRAIFVGSSEGDSMLAKVEVSRDTSGEEIKVEGGGDEDMDGRKEAMEVDYDEDLYGDAPIDDSHLVKVDPAAMPTGPIKVTVSPYDVLAGVGKINDIEFGIAATDQGAARTAETKIRTYPQLVAISGGSQHSTFNVFRRGVPITKRRKFNELAHAEGVWFLPIQRQSAGQRFKNIPDNERSTLLFSSEGSQTRIFALSTKANPEQIGRIAQVTVQAAPFFQRSCVLHVSPTQVSLLDSDGKSLQTVFTCGPGSAHILAASISDPYVVVRTADGRARLFVGDTVARTIAEAPIPAESSTDVEFESPHILCQAIEVFSDHTGVYRTFEARQDGSHSQINGSGIANGHGSSHARKHGQGQSSRIQLTTEQLKRLQEEKPAISADVAPNVEVAMSAGRGTQWLALLLQTGELQIRSLPDLAIVLQSGGLVSSDPSFTDDLGDRGVVPNAPDEQDVVRQMSFLPVGARTLRPHLLVLHASGRLNIYEALPRYTLDATQSESRRSLAIRYRKVHTQLLPIPSTSKLSYGILPFSNIEGLTGAFIVGEKPHWIVGSDSHPLRAFGLKQAAMAFGRTTHLGGAGEYFIRIEDGAFICYLPPTLNTEFTMPCDRYPMERNYSNIAFDPASAHYVGASTLPTPFQAYDEEGEIQIGPEGENLIPPINERSSLELFSQGSDPWRVIDGYDFDQNEVVLCLQSVTLESSSVPGGYRDFIAVGTGFDFGEDRASRGNLYVFEVVETVGETPKTSGWKLKFRTKDQARNPVSAIGNINGYLLNSNGPKLYAKGFDYDERLMALAFVDVGLYVTSIKVFKNFMLFGDAMKSIWFAALQETPYKFTVLAKDLQNVSIVTADFMVHEGQVSFNTTDRDGAMRIVSYDPADPDSLNGERLLLRTEYDLGSTVTVAKTIARRRAAEEEFAPQTQLIYAHSDGSISTLVAVKSARFKRLQLVSDQLVRNAQHVAGLNPRSFRTVRNDIAPKPLSRGILDGNLLNHFALQPARRQREMMRQIGSDGMTVASDLQALGGFW